MYVGGYETQKEGQAREAEGCGMKEVEGELGSSIQ